MLNLITVDQQVVVNGVTYKNAQEALSALTSYVGAVEILINSKSATNAPATPQKAPEAPKTETTGSTVKILKIEVREYMTKKGSPDFDFMIKYNNDKPMPMRRMYGEILEETKGMYRMRLHGRAERNASNCSHCMRELTHPISMYYGLGPICGEHMYMAPMKTLEKIGDQEELFKMADEKLRATEWTGWIIKKAILTMDVVEEKKVKRGVDLF